MSKYVKLEKKKAKFQKHKVFEDSASKPFGGFVPFSNIAFPENSSNFGFAQN